MFTMDFAVAWMWSAVLFSIISPESFIPSVISNTGMNGCFEYRSNISSRASEIEFRIGGRFPARSASYTSSAAAAMAASGVSIESGDGNVLLDLSNDCPP